MTVKQTSAEVVAIYRDCYQPDDSHTAEAAAYLAATIDQAFNPNDGDGAQESLLAEAVWRAVSFIEDQRCTCDPVNPYEEGPCDRCYALGRISDRGNL